MTREEALEILKGMKYPYNYKENKMIISNVNEETEALEMAISALEQEPCEDAISREAVLSIIDGWYEQNRDTENIEDLIILITYMSSVTQKSGKWKVTPMSKIAYCSICDELIKDIPVNIVTQFEFCPNCGCRMVEPRESEETEAWNGIHGQITAPKGIFKKIFEDAESEDKE